MQSQTTILDIDNIRKSNSYKMVMENSSRIFSIRPRMNNTISSYCMKHVLEDFLQTVPEFKGDTYAHNNTFIIAMEDQGYKLKRLHNSSNYTMNVKINKSRLKLAGINV